MELMIRCTDEEKITEIEFMGKKFSFGLETTGDLKDLYSAGEAERWRALMEVAETGASDAIPMVVGLPKMLGSMLLRGKVRCRSVMGGYIFECSDMKPFLRVMQRDGKFSDVFFADAENDEELFPEMVALNNQLATTQREFAKANESLKRAQRELTKKNQALAKAQDDLKKAYATKSIFLANMSHELRTPLHGIIGNSELLKESGLDARQQSLLGDIVYSGSLMLEMVNDILDGSKLETGRYELKEEAFPLVPHIQAAFNLLSVRASQKGLEYRLEFDDTLPDMVVGDALHLGQVLINLLSNAVKFTETGEVVCEVKKISSREICFVVRDTGQGIPKKETKKLFKPFVQLGPSGLAGGTGLGLYIASRLVELMGGSLTVNSILGQGSVFSFTLPLIPEVVKVGKLPELPSDEQEAPTGKSFSGFSCLVVEDNEVNRKIMLKQLELFGMDCDWTSNGKDAVAKCKAKQYRIIFMDYNLPGMNGSDATSAIRKIPGYARKDACLIIATTASILPAEVEASHRAGMDYFLPKPYRLEELKLSLQKWFFEN